MKKLLAIIGLVKSHQNKSKRKNKRTNRTSTQGRGKSGIVSSVIRGLSGRR